MTWVSDVLLVYVFAGQSKMTLSSQLILF